MGDKLCSKWGIKQDPHESLPNVLQGSFAVSHKMHKWTFPFFIFHFSFLCAKSKVSKKGKWSWGLAGWLTAFLYAFSICQLEEEMASSTRRWNRTAWEYSCSCTKQQDWKLIWKLGGRLIKEVIWNRLKINLRYAHLQQGWCKLYSEISSYFTSL